MAKFCSECGSPLDLNTGLCPNCNMAESHEYNQQMPAAQIEMSGQNQMNQTQTPIQNAQVPTQNAQVPTQNAQVPTQNAQIPTQGVQAPIPTQVAEDNIIEETTPVIEAAPVEGVVPEPIVKKKSGFKVAVTVILSVFLFSTIFLCTMIFGARSAVKEKNVEKILNSIDIFDAFDFADVEVEDDLAEFYDYMYSLGYYMDDEKTEAFVEESTGKEFAAQKTSEFFEDLYEGKNAKLTVTRDEIISLINDNEELVEEEIGYMDDYDKYRVADWFTKGEEERDYITARGLEDKEPELYNMAYYGTSYVTLIILILIALILILIMCFNNLRQALLGMGTVFAVCGGSIVLMWIITACAPRLIGKLIGDAFVGAVIGGAVSMVGILGLIFVVISVTAFVVRRLITEK